MKPTGRPAIPEGEDPNRATILEVLKELNRSEETAANEVENGLEMQEIEERLLEFWAIREGHVELRNMLAMLNTNRMIEFDGAKKYSWVRKRNLSGVYRITTDGKEYLRSNVDSRERIM
jgi:hypothetical protein